MSPVRVEELKKKPVLIEPKRHNSCEENATSNQQDKSHHSGEQHNCPTRALIIDPNPPDHLPDYKNKAGQDTLDSIIRLVGSLDDCGSAYITRRGRARIGCFVAGNAVRGGVGTNGSEIASLGGSPSPNMAHEHLLEESLQESSKDLIHRHAAVLSNDIDY